MLGAGGARGRGGAGARGRGSSAGARGGGAGTAQDRYYQDRYFPPRPCAGSGLSGAAGVALRLPDLLLPIVARTEKIPVSILLESSNRDLGEREPSPATATTRNDGTKWNLSEYSVRDRIRHHEMESK